MATVREVIQTEGRVVVAPDHAAALRHLEARRSENARGIVTGVLLHGNHTHGYITLAELTALRPEQRFTARQWATELATNRDWHRNGEGP